MTKSLLTMHIINIKHIYITIAITNIIIVCYNITKLATFILIISVGVLWPRPMGAMHTIHAIIRNCRELANKVSLSTVQ